MAVAMKEIELEATVEARVAKVEQGVEALQVAVSDLKTDIRRIDAKVDGVQASVAALHITMKDGFAAAEQRTAALELRTMESHGSTATAIVSLEGRALEQITKTDARLSTAIGSTDAKLSAQITETDARLSASIAATDAKLSAQIAESNTRLSASIAATDAKLSAQIAEADARLNASITALGASLHAAIAQSVAKLQKSRWIDKVWWLGLAGTLLGVMARGFHWI